MSNNLMHCLQVTQYTIVVVGWFYQSEELSSLYLPLFILSFSITLFFSSFILFSLGLGNVAIAGCPVFLSCLQTISQGYHWSFFQGLLNLRCVWQDYGLYGGGRSY